MPSALKSDLVLGIETSCDETAASVLRGPRQVLSNVVATQVPVHRRYGGVVHGLASRQHILDIETSCDESSASVLRGPRQFLSIVVATHVPLHRRYGGVVPELASRQHILAIDTVIQESLDKAGVTLRDLGGIAVTYGPGLVG